MTTPCVSAQARGGVWHVTRGQQGGGATAGWRARVAGLGGGVLGLVELGVVEQARAEGGCNSVT